MALFTIEQLERAESYLADEKYDTILPAFEGMVADMEVYIDEMCPTSDEVQWFSFASPFERLTYQRVESDPRELRDVPVPFDRAYADLAFCQINLERFEEAAANLKQAVRWNPMNCSHRLNLAGVLRHTGDYEEFLRLSYSVFARASHSWHLVRAYDNFADYFMNCEQYDTAAACVKCGLRLNKDDKRLLERAEELREERQCDPATQTDELTEALLDPQGIPEGANVEVVLSALLLADIAAARKDMQTCADMAQIAVDLVGQHRATALAHMVSEAAQEAYPEEGDDEPPVASDVADPNAAATLDAAVARARGAAGVQAGRVASADATDASAGHAKAGD